MVPWVTSPHVALQKLNDTCTSFCPALESRKGCWVISANKNRHLDLTKPCVFCQPRAHRVSVNEFASLIAVALFYGMNMLGRMQYDVALNVAMCKIRCVKCSADLKKR